MCYIEKKSWKDRILFSHTSSEIVFYLDWAYPLQT